MFLSKVTIKNFRGIADLSFRFNEKINIIIGENGAFKSTVVDAIRLLYNLGDENRDIFVKNEDFHIDDVSGEISEKLSISYEFRGLSEKEKGALYEYLVFKSDDQYAAITIFYERKEYQNPKFNYYSGEHAGQKANPGTFDIFQHYYLSALRDSTSDLLNTRKNVLGRVLKRGIESKKSEENYKSIIQGANKALLEQSEVKDTKQGINDNLDDIHKMLPKIDLHIEQTKLDYIINVIKPFLPLPGPKSPGVLTLNQNSLGYNNLIYIATVLSDINERVTSEEVIHFSLLIEEPEAHLHPQLQLNLYNFLKQKNCPSNCQLFITTHSPTLTSKVELDNLFLIDSSEAKCIGKCFIGRESDSIKQNAKLLRDNDYAEKKRMLERYIDVTKSQLFYAKSILMVEGISEELLLMAFAQIEGFRLEEYDIELVQTGTSFYPFLLLFNSKDKSKRLNKKVAILTDDDRFTDSKNCEYSFEELIRDDYSKLIELQQKIDSGTECSRITNLEEFRNVNDGIKLYKAFKTLEYEIAYSNVNMKKVEFQNNRLVKFLQDSNRDKFSKIDTYINSCGKELSEAERKRVAILIWKIMPGKADFAQEFAFHLLDNIEAAKLDFVIPPYIKNALTQLRQR